MAARAFRGEDLAGLAIALAAHAGLLALLVLQPDRSPVVPAPERVTVTLAEEVGLTSTSPEPQAEAAAPAAPEMAQLAEPEPAPRAALPALPQPAPQPVRQPAPQPVPAPRIKPAPVAVPAPAPRAQPQARAVPTTAPRAAAAQSRPTKARPAPAAAARPAGASRISNDFLKGVPAGKASGAANSPPAAAIGPAVQSALAGAISRQLKPHWIAPQGADAEKLVTILSWSLNRDGSLTGAPRLVRQDGITDTNRPQAARHAEQAMRAVQLAAPFTLPAEYYGAWQRVASFRFDKRLSQ
jgi:outer membrane biosynthesis protein TonB